MIETYIYKTIISFIVLNCVMYITKDNWLKLSPKKNGFVKRNFNKLVWCLIPVVRWIFITFVLIFGIALNSEEFYKKYSEELEKNK